MGILAPTKTTSSRLPSSFANSLFNVPYRGAEDGRVAAQLKAAVDDRVVAEDFLAAVVVDVPAAEVVEADPVAAEVVGKSEIYAADQLSRCGNCRVRATF